MLSNKGLPTSADDNMVDEKAEMNNDSENYSTANSNDPKNVQELTQYVSTRGKNTNFLLFLCSNCVISSFYGIFVKTTVFLLRQCLLYDNASARTTIGWFRQLGIEFFVSAYYYFQ